MTGPLERPSQGAPENRKAEHRSPHREQRGVSSSAALRLVHRAEMDLLIAAQRAARQSAFRAIDAALGAHNSSAAAAVVHRFAEQRAALAGLDANARAAALRRISAEEATELARLAITHAAEKRALKGATMQAMGPAQKNARNALRRSSRRQRIVFAVSIRPIPHTRTETTGGYARPSFRILARR